MNDDTRTQPSEMSVGEWIVVLAILAAIAYFVGGYIIGLFIPDELTTGENVCSTFSRGWTSEYGECVDRIDAMD